MPWQWEILSNEPSNLYRIKLNMIWGPSDTAKGKCSGSSISMNLIGEISDEQIKVSKQTDWPYGQCRKESTGKKFIPYTSSCYEASREMSTLRKYKIFTQYENVSFEKSFIFVTMFIKYTNYIYDGNDSYQRACTSLFGEHMLYMI